MIVDPEDLPHIDHRAHMPGRFDVAAAILSALSVVALLIFVALS